MQSLNLVTRSPISRLGADPGICEVTRRVIDHIAVQYFESVERADAADPKIGMATSVRGLCPGKCSSAHQKLEKAAMLYPHPTYPRVVDNQAQYTQAPDSPFGY
jgi:hypothetical protein